MTTTRRASGAAAGLTVVGGALLASLAMVGAVCSAGAQEDFRAADADRPIRVEDAYPLKYLEWEWQLGSRTEWAEGGRYQASWLLELKTGIARNWQLGLEAHPAWTRAAAESSGGLEEFGGHLLFNLNQETAALPALSVRADVVTPGLGDVGREKAGGRVLGIVTASRSRLRLHGNAGYSWASAADGGDFWRAGLALDYPVGLFSKLVLGDVYTEFPARGGDARVWGELGSRFQLTNSVVLDFGLTSRLDEWAEGLANVGFVVGISRVFGISGLVEVPGYPNPTLK